MSRRRYRPRTVYLSIRLFYSFILITWLSDSFHFVLSLEQIQVNECPVDIDKGFQEVFRTYLAPYSKPSGCLTYTEDKFWTYKWCLNDAIYQHGSKFSNFENILLGKEDKLEIKTSARGTYLEITYKDGTYCPEINKSRDTVVQLVCCPMSRFKPLIERISEEVVCNYILQICIPEVCSIKLLQTLFEDNTLSELSTRFEILEALNPVNSDEQRKFSFSEKHLEGLREEVKEIFYKSYDAYMKYAFPKDELMPLSCHGTNFALTAGEMLTLVDSLDTLIVLGNYSEFRTAVRIVIENLHFDINDTVSVFETNIRVLGGLLSAHLLSEDPEIVPNYRGELLELAIDLGDRLMPSFDTLTGIPYGTVHLQHGVPDGETTHACTSAAGSLSIEFGMLSVLSGDSKYGVTSRKALSAIFERRSNLDLVGRHIDVQTGEWIETGAGIGPNIDSFYEYALKHYILFGDEEAFEMYQILYEGALKHMKNGNRWYKEVDMHRGIPIRKIFNNLMSFWPGLQTLSGDRIAASKTLNAFLSVWNEFGFTPEDFDYQKWEPVGSTRSKSYPLRPELIESVFYMHEATNHTSWLRAGIHILSSLKRAQVDDSICPGAFATVTSISALEHIPFSHLPGVHTEQMANYINELNTSNEEKDLSLSILQFIFKKSMLTDLGLLKLEIQSMFPLIDTSILDVLMDILQDLQSMSYKRFKPTFSDYMPSFFLSEVCKYLFLLFSPDHKLRGSSGINFIFSTEAHLFPINLTFQLIASDMGFAFPSVESKSRLLASTWQNYHSETSVFNEFYFARQCSEEDILFPGAIESYFLEDEDYATHRQLFSKKVYSPGNRGIEDQNGEKGYLQRLFDAASNIFKTSSKINTMPQNKHSNVVLLETINAKGIVTKFNVHPYSDGGFSILETDRFNYVDIRALGTASTSFHFGYSNVAKNESIFSSSLHSPERWFHKKSFCPLTNSAKNLLKSQQAIKRKQDIVDQSPVLHHTAYIFTDTTLSSNKPRKGFETQVIFGLNEMSGGVCLKMVPLQLLLQLARYVYLSYSSLFFPVSLSLHQGSFGSQVWSEEYFEGRLITFGKYPFLSCTSKDENIIKENLNLLEDTRIPVVDRNGCMFEDKADKFKGYDVSALIIAQNKDEPLFLMSGRNNGYENTIDFPVFLISYFDALIIYEIMKYTQQFPSFYIGGLIQKKILHNSYMQVTVKNQEVSFIHPAGWGGSITVQQNRWNLNILDYRE